MCGIFGVIAAETCEIDRRELRRSTDHLFKLAESRGKEAAGLAMLAGDSIRVVKTPRAASLLIRSPEYRDVFRAAFDTGTGSGSGTDASAIRVPFALLGHSRLVTNGSQEQHDNNQPVVASGAVGVHNGIIANVEDLWGSYPDLNRKYEIDTEVLFSLIQHFLGAQGASGDLAQAVSRAYELVDGDASIAILFEDLDCLLLATNTGSIYMASSAARDMHVFLSERFMLETFLDKGRLRAQLGDATVEQLLPGTGCVIDLKTLERRDFEIGSSNNLAVHMDRLPSVRQIVDQSALPASAVPEAVGRGVEVWASSGFTDAYPENAAKIDALRRCSRCVLPETIPFIEFDAEGVCNYCHGYTRLEFRGEQALRDVLAPYRRSDARPDCIVAFSGGRDSSYGLHYLKTVLEMNPVAYTYDWGMLTDLGRRNVSRICGKLGVEHILVSADIGRKRANIQKNVLAWLKNLDLGLVPIFMAGDKAFFYHANRLKKQMGIPVDIWSVNLLERTEFKVGFCGIEPESRQTKHYKLNSLNTARLAAYYAKNFLRTPAFLNVSLLDTFAAFCSYYLIDQNYIQLFEYLPWDEKTVESTLISEYGWEVAPDTPTTWRIGDGTAPFYNYIYYTMAGFTEADTFRSNQVREGTLDRAEALELVRRENEPRYSAIGWYCDTIGIDFGSTIDAINGAAKIYAG